MKYLYAIIAAALAILGLIFIVGFAGSIVRLVIGIVLFIAAGAVVYLSRSKAPALANHRRPADRPQRRRQPGKNMKCKVCGAADQGRDRRQGRRDLHQLLALRLDLPVRGAAEVVNLRTDLRQRIRAHLSTATSDFPRVSSFPPRTERKNQTGMALPLVCTPTASPTPTATNGASICGSIPDGSGVLFPRRNRCHPSERHRHRDRPPRAGGRTAGSRPPPVAPYIRQERQQRTA